jgi:hypothetical protein
MWPIATVVAYWVLLPTNSTNPTRPTHPPYPTNSTNPIGTVITEHHEGFKLCAELFATRKSCEEFVEVITLLTIKNLPTLLTLFTLLKLPTLLAQCILLTLRTRVIPETLITHFLSTYLLTWHFWLSGPGHSSEILPLRRVVDQHREPHTGCVGT